MLLCSSGMAIADAKKDGGVLRAGDVLNISLPGEDSFNKPFQIDRQGKVLLPEIGEVQLAGLSLAEAKATLGQQLSVLFRDVGRFELTIQERKLLVNVLGLVKNPGPVELPADGTIQMAINGAGGLVAGAQLDRMQIQRSSGNISFDYKHYLDSGEQGKMPTLQSLDTVFVPASPLLGNVQIDFDARTLAAQGDGNDQELSVKVFGEVRTPGLFAYRNGASVIDMLMRAGGVTDKAAVEQIRVINGNKPVAFNLKDYLDTGNEKILPTLQPGATIFVPIATEGVKAGASIVYVMGEVAKPGAYENKSANASFMDILANAGGPTRYAESRQIRLIHSNGKVEAVDLQAFTESGGTGKLPKVSSGDTILVPEKSDLNQQSWLKVTPNRAIRMIGAVKSPGRYEWSNEMNFLDLLSQAGGPTNKSDIAHVQILAPGSSKTGKPLIFDLEKFIDEGGSTDRLPHIGAGYTIIIPELPEDPSSNKSQWTRQAAEHSIYVFGEVGQPGRYAFTTSLGFLDILAAADGPNKTADLYNIRVSHRNGNHPEVTTINLVQYFETGDETLLPKVKPGDVIYIPSQEKQWLEDKKEQTVRVLGAVNKAGRYRFNDSMTILDLLAEAGGPRSDAYQRKIVVVNYSCCKDQARVFDLEKFAKSGDYSKLPVLRAGDTVYVPDQSQSMWKSTMDVVKDAFSVLSVLVIVGAL